MTDLIIRGCSEQFAEMVKDIHRVLQNGVRGAVRINMSGNPSCFKYIYLEIEPGNAKKVTEPKEIDGKTKE